MNQKTLFLITVCNTILLLVLSTFLFFKFVQDEDEIVYVDNVRLFNGFNMTRDMNRINGEKISRQKKKLDSLYTIYGIFKDNNQTDKLEALEVRLRNEDQELKSMNERFSNEISQAVWNRLNSYIKDYGVDKGYKIVLGTQGNGNVMFAKEGTDVTEAVIVYSNRLYEGEL